MIVPSSIQQHYYLIEPYIKKLTEQVRSALLNYCDKNNFAFCGRIKTLQSLSEKLESGRYKNWEEIDDLYACSIIIPNLDYENDVINFVKKTFKVEKVKKKGSALQSPEIYRFDSTRIICRYTQDTSIKTSFNNILFEIQVKSAFEHAWSVSTHKLGYKSNSVDWKMLRIVTQIKSTVEQMDTLVLGAEKISKFVSEHKDFELDSKKYFLNYFMQKFENKEIPDELKPLNFSRLCDNIISLIKNSSIYDSKKILKISKSLVELIDIEILRCNYEMFPKSISLFQFILCVIINNDFLEIVQDKYYALITNELESLCPKFKNVNKRFLIETT